MIPASVLDRGASGRGAGVSTKLGASSSLTIRNLAVHSVLAATGGTVAKSGELSPRLGIEATAVLYRNTFILHAHYSWQ